MTNIPSGEHRERVASNLQAASSLQGAGGERRREPSTCGVDRARRTEPRAALLSTCAVDLGLLHLSHLLKKSLSSLGQTCILFFHFI